jgi:exodeoxyribonuclease VII small subunit
MEWNMAKKNISYTEAIGQIEEMIRQIETGELDVDQLAVKVKQVTELLKLCKSKLTDTEKEVDKILREMEEAEE